MTSLQGTYLKSYTVTGYNVNGFGRLLIVSVYAQVLNVDILYLEQKIEDDFYITSFYDLEYETRNKENENSSEFLKKINNIKEDESKKNIDFYYMNNTFNVIKQWFTDNKINKGDFLNILLKVNIIEENKQKIDINSYEVEK